jgi:hypothetical protein
MTKTLGVFISDIHIPDHIELKGVFEYIKDLSVQAKKQKARFEIILGGDILDAKGMHGIDQLPAQSIKLEWYERDKKLLYDFLTELKGICDPDKVVYLEGNHEERYQRIMKRYPDAWGSRFDFNKDVLQKVFPKAEWISYGTYESFYQVGDCLFMHGTMYPENHAKQYVLKYLPSKVVYGHLHHYQAFTYHSGNPALPPRYAVTGGCLSHLAPEWKKGTPHMWQNGFVDFISENGVTTPSVHLIEKGKFYVGGKEYK